MPVRKNEGQGSLDGSTGCVTLDMGSEWRRVLVNVGTSVAVVLILSIGPCPLAKLYEPAAPEWKPQRATGRSFLNHTPEKNGNTEYPSPNQAWWFLSAFLSGCVCPFVADAEN